MSHATYATEPASTELHLARQLRDDIARRAEADYPHEACGILVGRAAARRVEVERVAAGRNVNRERAGDRYEIDPQDILAADGAARRDGLEIVGYWHSHPDCPARPSTTDLAAAWEGYSYVIVGVTAAGDTDFHSWRLDGGRFHEERILPQDARPPVAALRFENLLKEERTT